MLLVAVTGTEEGEQLGSTEHTGTNQSGSPEAASAVVARDTSGIKAKAEYEERRVWIRPSAASKPETEPTGSDIFDLLPDDRSEAAAAAWFRAYKGKNTEPLEGAAFYEYIGHPDLAQRYRSRATRKVWLGAAGAVAGVGGVAMLVVGLRRSAGARTTEECWNAFPDHVCRQEIQAEYADHVSSGKLLTGVGIGVALVGTATLLFARFINPHPVDDAEAQRLANDFNEKLRGKLGLEPQAKPPRAAPAAPEPRLDATPLLGPGTGGLALTVSF